MEPPLDAASDAALVLAVGRWQQRALAELYRRHAGVVYGLARRVLGDGTAAEEIVQEIFLRLWRQPERFEPDRGSLRSFLLAQAHGRSVDRLRSETARRRREERHVMEAPRHSDDIDQQVADLVVADHVRAALHTLPVDERRAIELAYFGGHSYRQVAVLLGAPEGTIKSRIRTGLGRLGDRLERTGMGVRWQTS